MPRDLQYSSTIYSTIDAKLRRSCSAAATAQATLDQEGRFKTNMPVSQQLRVVFDEPDTASGHPPTALFLVGRQDDAYRIALVVPVKPPGGRD